jgi:hypothetical protein
MPKNAESNLKELILKLTKRKVNVRIHNTNYYYDHICSITFNTRTGKFTLLADISDYKKYLSLDDGLKLLNESTLEDMTLFEEGEISNIINSLSRETVTPGVNEDYTSSLVYNKNTQLFAVNFGSSLVKIPILDAMKLMREGELPSMVLL